MSDPIPYHPGRRTRIIFAMESAYPSEMIEALRAARHVFVFTGAGISKESGLPTFRDDDGLWQKYDPAILATPDGFARYPVKVWNMYRERQKILAQAEPNPAHITLAQMENYYPEFLLATQNIDDLHERAGSRKIVKIHGDAWQMRCTGCGKIFDIRQFDLPDEFTISTLPKCPRCEALCRPNVVWFGEYVPLGPMQAARNSASNCDVMLIIGTSGEVSGGYGFAEFARSGGAKVIEINPAGGALTRHAHFWIPEPAGSALPDLWQRVISTI